MEFSMDAQITRLWNVPQLGYESKFILWTFNLISRMRKITSIVIHIAVKKAKTLSAAADL